MSVSIRNSSIVFLLTHCDTQLRSSGICAMWRILICVCEYLRQFSARRNWVNTFCRFWLVVGDEVRKEERMARAIQWCRCVSRQATRASKKKESRIHTHTLTSAAFCTETIHHIDANESSLFFCGHFAERTFVDDHANGHRSSPLSARVVRAPRRAEQTIQRNGRVLRSSSKWFHQSSRSLRSQQALRRRHSQ